MFDVHPRPPPRSSGFSLPPSSFSRTAFTLIELLIVVVIAFLLLALIGVLSRNLEEKGRRSRAQTELAHIQGALQDYRGEQGVYPNTLDDVTNRLPRTFTSFDSAGAPVDPWGSRYLFVKNPNGLTYTLFSCGPDGIDTNVDDNISAGRF